MMVQYEVTKRHQLLKEGIILEPSIDVGNYFSSAWAHQFSKDEIDDWINSGWIEEIQEPEFTKNDMIDFASSCIIKWETEPKGRINYVNEFDKFKKQNNGNQKIHRTNTNQSR